MIGLQAHPPRFLGDESDQPFRVGEIIVAESYQHAARACLHLPHPGAPAQRLDLDDIEQMVDLLGQRSEAIDHFRREAIDFGCRIHLRQTPVKPEPKDSIPVLAPTLPAPVNHPDAHAGAAGVVSSGQDQHPGRLVIGRDIRLKGEITACDELVVDGDLDAAVVAQHLKISSGGAVVGRFEVRTADIGGRFTGDLIVGENLSIRAGGQIEGRVRYGTIEVAMGGVLRGDLDELDRTSDTAEASADSVGATLPTALENAS